MSQKKALAAPPLANSTTHTGHGNGKSQPDDPHDHGRVPGGPSNTLPGAGVHLDHTHDSDAHGHVHVMPLQLLFTIFFALIFFTIATVVISKFHLGAWEVPVSMAIATTKAILVAVYFMHLRYDNPFNAMIFCFSLFFVALFLGGTLMDVRAYQKDLIPPTTNASTNAAP